MQQSRREFFGSALLATPLAAPLLQTPQPQYSLGQRFRLLTLPFVSSVYEVICVITLRDKEGVSFMYTMSEDDKPRFKVHEEDVPRFFEAV